MPRSLYGSTITMQRRLSVIIGTYWCASLFFPFIFSFLIMSSMYYFKGPPFEYDYFKDNLAKVSTFSVVFLFHLFSIT
jgi:hypothetical protein